MRDEIAHNEAACGGSDLTEELGTDFDNTEERYLRETLAMLNAHHEKMIKPYIDRLAFLQILRPMPLDLHYSDCATHNEPAYPNGECDCGPVPNAEVTSRPTQRAMINE